MYCALRRHRPPGADGNPKALQDQLRHQDARMTLEYQTVSAKRSLEIQQGVDFGW